MGCCSMAPSCTALFFADRRLIVLTFLVQGHRLGTANLPSPANYSASGAPATNQRDDNVPEPLIDKNLTEEERAKIRADRAAAAEARLKKQGGAPGKRKTSSNAPLRGPNSKPTMTWTAG